MPNNIVETDSYPAVLQTPAAGELASAPGILAAFLQGAANRFKWLQTRVNKLVAGGAFTPAGDLSFTTPNGNVIGLNGVTIRSHLAGAPELVTNGAISGRVWAYQGNGSAGTHAVSSAYNLVYSPSSVTSGCIWQISSNPPSHTGEPSALWCMRFINTSTTVITVRNPAGSTMGTLVYTSGNCFAFTLAWNGSTWFKLDPSFLP